MMPALFILCIAFGAWAVLSLVAGERERLVSDLEARQQAEADAAVAAAAALRPAPSPKPPKSAWPTKPVSSRAARP